MLRLVVLVAIATVVSGSGQNATGSNPNTRLFGLGNVINGAIGALGGALAGGVNGGLQGANPGFQVQGGFNRPQQPGFNVQGGFNPGFQQQGFNQFNPALQQQQFPGQQLFPGQQQFPGQQLFPGQQQFPGQQFPGQQFPGQVFPGQQIIPTGNIPVGAAIVNAGIADNRPVIQSAGATCRRWCKNDRNQAFCCESGNEAQQTAATKGGLCPPKRPSCPPTRSFAPPKSCSSDGACTGLLKCCPDECLGHPVCKPPQGTGK